MNASASTSRSILLIRRVEEERERLRALEGEISQAYGHAGEEDWPGDHELLDRAQRSITSALPSLSDAEDHLAHFVGTIQLDEAKTR